MRTIRTYSELVQLPTFEERFEYLKLGGRVGEETFGFDRYLNQVFYRSQRWKRIRDEVIIRDNACDLGVEGYDIRGSIFIHHINPIDVDDVINESDYLLNPEFLICTRRITHTAIHYGDDGRLFLTAPVERRKNDTCPWRQ